MFMFFFFSSRRRHTRCALVTGVQTCALPICAEVALKAAIDEAERMNIRLCVAVVDRAGHLLAFRRMDGAPPPSIDVATAKAQTAALFGVPSKTFQTMVNEGQEIGRAHV